MKALIDADGIRVAQIVPDGETFSVAPPLKWVDAPPDVTTEYRYDSGALVPPDSPPPPVDEIDGRVAGDPVFAALIRMIAADSGRTEADVVAALKAQAGG